MLVPMKDSLMTAQKHHFAIPAPGAGNEHAPHELVLVVEGQHGLRVFRGAAQQQLELAVPLYQVHGADDRGEAQLRTGAQPDIHALPVGGGAAVEVAVVQGVAYGGIPGMGAAPWAVDHRRETPDQLLQGAPETELFHGQASSSTCTVTENPSFPGIWPERVSFRRKPQLS